MIEGLQHSISIVAFNTIAFDNYEIELINSRCDKKQASFVNEGKSDLDINFSKQQLLASVKAFRRELGNIGGRTSVVIATALAA